MQPHHPVQTLELVNAVTEEEKAHTKWWEAQYKIRALKDHIARLKIEKKEAEATKASVSTKEAEKLAGAVETMSIDQEERK